MTHLQPAALALPAPWIGLPQLPQSALPSITSPASGVLHQGNSARREALHRQGNRVDVG